MLKFGKSWSFLEEILQIFLIYFLKNIALKTEIFFSKLKKFYQNFERKKLKIFFENLYFLTEKYRFLGS